MTIEYPLPITKDLQRMQDVMIKLHVMHALLTETKIAKRAGQRYAANANWENSKQGQQAIENVRTKTLAQREDEDRLDKHMVTDFFQDPFVDFKKSTDVIIKSVCKKLQFPDPAPEWTNPAPKIPRICKRLYADYDKRRTSAITTLLGHARNSELERADVARFLLLCNTTLFRPREEVDNLGRYLELDIKQADKVDEFAREIYNRKHNNNNAGRSV